MIQSMRRSLVGSGMRLSSASACCGDWLTSASSQVQDILALCTANGLRRHHAKSPYSQGHKSHLPGHDGEDGSCPPPLALVDVARTGAGLNA